MPFRTDQNLVGVIDVGSNSVRMVIYNLSDALPQKIFNEKVFCALGYNLGKSGLLNPQAIPLALKALEGYRLLSEVYRPRKLIIVGTAALRDAQDAPQFLRKVKDHLGLDIRVISGEEEAKYAARGVLMYDPEATGIVGDFGGGSLEFAKIGHDKVLDTISLPLGGYRIEDMGDKVEQNIADLFMPLVSRFGHEETLYAIGGAWRSLSKAYHIVYPKEAGVIAATHLLPFCQQLQHMSFAEIKAAYRFEDHRARLIPTSAYVLVKVLDYFKPQYFKASEAGIRDGILHEFLFTEAKKL